MSGASEALEVLRSALQKHRAERPQDFKASDDAVSPLRAFEILLGAILEIRTHIGI